MRKKVVVAGGGASGLIAAGQAAKRGNEVIIIEKNNIVGKKLLITGKGRCNITNDCDVQDLIDNIPGNGNFLYSVFYTFSSSDIMYFFNSEGLKLKTERGGRVFPVSDKAADVVEVLKNFALNNGAGIKYRTSCKEICTEGDEVSGVKLENGDFIKAQSVILATGGASYSGTGSTGDGYRIAKKLGHLIIQPGPSLVPLETKEKWVKELQGLTLKNVSVVMKSRDGKRLFSGFGELLFTHFGVSGPLILTGSRHIKNYNPKEIKLFIDLKPALSEEQLDKRIQRDFEEFSRKQFKNSLKELLPAKFIPVIVKLTKIPPEKFVNQLTRKERKTIVNLLKNVSLSIKSMRPLDEAIVTSGGICIKDIDPGTLESKIVRGLYFAGEVMDIDGYTGGYNLSIAFSTGYVAGVNC